VLRVDESSQHRVVRLHAQMLPYASTCTDAASFEVTQSDNYYGDANQCIRHHWHALQLQSCIHPLSSSSLQQALIPALVLKGSFAPPVYRCAVAGK
jgi:hypothetical protein